MKKAILVIIIILTATNAHAVDLSNASCGIVAESYNDGWANPSIRGVYPNAGAAEAAANAQLASAGSGGVAGPASCDPLFMPAYWQSYRWQGNTGRPAYYYIYPVTGATCPDGTSPYTEAPIDTDGDGWPDDEDECPNDPGKHEQGVCGCGVPDTDTDGDGLLDCVDPSPEKNNEHGRAVVLNKATCNGTTIYVELGYEDGTVERYGDATEYNRIRNGYSTCTNAQLKGNSFPTSTWEWDMRDDVMNWEQILDEMKNGDLVGLTPNNGESETDIPAEQSVPKTGEEGTTGDDSGNLNKIATNTSKVTENQGITNTKIDSTNSLLSDIKNILGAATNVASSTTYEGPSASDIANANDQKADENLSQQDDTSQSFLSSLTNFTIDSSEIDAKTTVTSGTDYTEPGSLSDESWWTDFRSNNPFQTALNGTTVTTTNPTCSMSVDLGGNFGTISLSMCNMADFLATFRLIFLPIVTLTALVMVMRG